ncbi:hypothetical protein V8F06_004334 [Rhypophila decipiens]
MDWGKQTGATSNLSAFLWSFFLGSVISCKSCMDSTHTRYTSSPNIFRVNHVVPSELQSSKKTLAPLLQFLSTCLLLFSRVVGPSEKNLAAVSIRQGELRLNSGKSQGKDMMDDTYDTKWDGVFVPSQYIPRKLNREPGRDLL